MMFRAAAARAASLITGAAVGTSCNGSPASSCNGSPEQPSTSSRIDALSERLRSLEAGSAAGGGAASCPTLKTKKKPAVVPISVGTWQFSDSAASTAGRMMEQGASALDAVEAGINVVELDTSEQFYVGYGGLPNADGTMEMDAAIMVR